MMSGNIVTRAGVARFSGNGSSSISLIARPPNCRHDTGSISEAMKVE
jgi:hypothetical protein